MEKEWKNVGHITIVLYSLCLLVYICVMSGYVVCSMQSLRYHRASMTV